MKRICVTNRLLCQEDFLSRVQKIAAAGADAILLREKDLSETQYAILAKQVQEICLLYNVSLLLNSFGKPQPLCTFRFSSRCRSFKSCHLLIGRKFRR